MSTPVRAVALVVKDDDSQTVENPLLLFHPRSSDFTLTNAAVAMTVESFANGKFTGALNCYADRLGGDTYFELDAQDITDINFPELSSIEDEAAVYFLSHPLLASVNFKSLSEITTDAALYLQHCPLLVTASFPIFATLAGTLNLDSNDSLASISCPSLASVNNFLCTNNAALQSISLPSLASIAGFAFHDNSALQSVSLPSLTTLEANANFNGYTSALLTSVSLPVLASVGDGAQISLAGCALTQQVVNDLLVKINAAKQGIGLLDLSVGTSAAPSGVGVTAKNALIGVGWTVDTN